MLTPYIIIFVVGLFFMLLLNKLSLISHFRKSFYANKKFFWVTLIIITMLFAPFGEMDSFEAGDSLGISRIVRLLGFALLSLISIIYITKHQIFPKRSILYLFLIYILVCFFSSLYSPNRIETIWKSFELLALFIITLVLNNELRIKKLSINNIYNSLIYLILIGVLFSIIGYFLFPEIALKTFNDFEGDLTKKSVWGILPSINPNSLGQFSAMLSFVGVYYLLFKKNIKGVSSLLLLIGMLGQMLAYSRTSILAFSLILIFLVFKKKSVKMKILAIFSLPMLLFFEDQLFEYLSRGQNIDQLSSLSGRTYMWKIAWESIQEHPIFGIGFYSGHKSMDIEIGMAFSSLDSTYLEALVDVGITGTIFLILFISKTLFKNYRLLQKNKITKFTHERGWEWIAFGFLVIMIIRSFSGPAFQIFHINLYFILLISISVNQKKYKLYSSKIFMAKYETLNTN